MYITITMAPKTWYLRYMYACEREAPPISPSDTPPRLPPGRHRRRHQEAHASRYRVPQRQVLRHGLRGFGLERSGHGGRLAARKPQRERERLVKQDADI